MASFARTAAVLALVALLPAFSGADDLALAVAEAGEPSGPAGGEDAPDPEDGVLVLINHTSEDLCALLISKFDEPDAEGYDLIETPLAPGDSVSFPYGSHPDTDEPNLVATAASCDGTVYHGWHFSYHHGGARYVVHDGMVVE